MVHGNKGEKILEQFVKVLMYIRVSAYFQAQLIHHTRQSGKFR